MKRGKLVASRLIRAKERRRRAGAAHALAAPWICSNGVLTGGGRKNVVTEEAVPRGGEWSGQGQRGLERRDLARGEASGDTVLEIG